MSEAQGRTSSDSEAGHEHGSCALSGCGEIAGTMAASGEAVDAVYRGRTRDRIERTPEMSPETLDRFLEARGRERRALLRRGGALGMLTAAGSLFSAVARASPSRGASLGTWLEGQGGGGGGGKVHVVESNTNNVHLGVFDSTLPDILQVESGDTIVYPDTWSHFLNKMQPGVPIDELAKMRLANPGKGPHSIIGPVGVKGAEPGDLLEIQFLKLVPVGWAANFNNPGSLGTGALADQFPDGQVKYFRLDLGKMTTQFNPDIQLSLAPFQGTFGIAPPDGFFGSTTGVVSSVPPGPHGGNIDLREMGQGSRLYIPVWKPGAKIFTGDSHALQGDGEVNLTALETAMKEVRVRVLLHKQVGWTWPFVETETHWIALGMDKDLNVAQRIALINAIDFLSKRAGLSRLDAYALCSLAVSFRVTQVVDVNKGIHAMIPKSIFAPAATKRISIA
ncbi:MAG TPA: acetamidase/formamidase family protein [Myxococcaceae bacterium]|nr:acetamidase/formamidase family protein [Myxococcaceae bacterium]